MEEVELTLPCLPRYLGPSGWRYEEVGWEEEELSWERKGRGGGGIRSDPARRGRGRFFGGV